MALLDSYYNVAEAAIFLGVHPETIKRLCQRGLIPAEKIHNTWLIRKDKLEQFSLTYNNPRRGRRKRQKQERTEAMGYNGTEGGL